MSKLSKQKNQDNSYDLSANTLKTDLENFKESIEKQDKESFKKTLESVKYINSEAKKELEESAEAGNWNNVSAIIKKIMDMLFSFISSNEENLDPAEFTQKKNDHNNDTSRVGSSIDITPLESATFRGDMAGVRNLLNNGVNINEQDGAGRTALHTLILLGYLDRIKFFVENGADVNIKNHNGEDIFHMAARSNNPEIIEYIASVKKKQNMNLQNNNGDTVLHITAPYANQTGHKCFLGLGVNPTIRNKRNELPEDIRNAVKNQPNHHLAFPQEHRSKGSDLNDYRI